MPQALDTLSPEQKSVLGTVFLILLLVCSTAHAQEKPCCSSNICAAQHHDSLPEAPKPKPESLVVESRDYHSSKVFWLGTALLAASNTADGITTRQVLDRGGQELNPMFGRHPSPARQAGIDAALFAVQVIAFHFTERSRYKPVRWAGRLFIAYQIADYTRAAACNSQIGAGIQFNPHQRCVPY